MIHRFACLAIVVLTAALFGCGGGGGGSSAVVPAPVNKTVTGVAATGAPIVGTIYLKDSSSPSIQLSTPIAADGSYSFDVTNLTAPYMLKAVGAANGQNYTLFSMAGAPGITNVNPLTHLAVTRANGGVDPAAIFAAMTPVQVQALQAAVAAAIAQMQTLIQPILAQYSIPTNTDFMAGTYTANHTGLDLLFDMISFAVNNGTMVATNKTSGAAIITTSLSGTTLSGTVTTGNLPTLPTVLTGAVYAYTLTPTITVGGTATFNAIVLGQASQSVTWSVVESGGGSITTAGVYTAPATAGIYHVKATNAANNSMNTTVAITVTSTNSTYSLGSGETTYTPILSELNNTAMWWSVKNTSCGGISYISGSIYYSIHYPSYSTVYPGTVASFSNGTVTLPSDTFQVFAKNTTSQYFVIKHSNKNGIFIEYQRWYYGTSSIADAANYAGITTSVFTSTMVSGKKWEINTTGPLFGGSTVDVTLNTNGTASFTTLIGSNSGKTVTGTWYINSAGSLVISNNTTTSVFQLMNTTATSQYTQYECVVTTGATVITATLFYSTT